MSGVAGEGHGERFGAMLSAEGLPGMPWIARGTLLRPWGDAGRRGCRGSPGVRFWQRGASRGDAERRGSSGMPRIARGAILRPRKAFWGDAECQRSLWMPRIAQGALSRPWGAIRGDAERRGSPGMPRLAGARFSGYGERLGPALSAGSRQGCRGSPGAHSVVQNQYSVVQTSTL